MTEGGNVDDVVGGKTQSITVGERYRAVTV
jgi:hypothetical protein